MKDFLAKLTSYNILNYLLPGTLFVAAFQPLAGHTISGGNLLIDAFVYYFIGMTVSRVGSLLIEPLCKRLNLVTYAPYEKYVEAAAHDETIAILLEQNNVYRTIVALILSLAIIVSAHWLMNCFGLPHLGQLMLLAAMLFILYAAAYSKQTAYIRKRVAKHTNAASVQDSEDT